MYKIIARDVSIERKTTVKDYIPNPSEEGYTEFNSQLLAPLLLLNPLPTNGHCRKCQRCSNVQSRATTAKSERTDFLDVSWLTGPPFASLVVNRVSCQRKKDLVCSLSVNYPLPCPLFSPIFLPQIFDQSFRTTVEDEQSRANRISLVTCLSSTPSLAAKNIIHPVESKRGEVGRILTIPAPTFSPSSWTNTRRTGEQATNIKAGGCSRFFFRA